MRELEMNVKYHNMEHTKTIPYPLSYKVTGTDSASRQSQCGVKGQSAKCRVL